MSSPPGFRLLAVTPPTGDVGVATVDAWVEAGALDLGLAVVLREPGTEPERVAAAPRFSGLMRACRARRIPLMLSCDPNQLPVAADLISRSDFQGLQVRGDPSLEVLYHARALVDGALLGRSCHGDPQPGNEQVDYTVLAPVFTPTTPPREKRPVGPASITRWARAGASLFALGGVGPDNAALCLAAGAHGLAGIGSFFGDPGRVTQDVAGLCAAVRGTASGHGSKTT